MRHHLRKYLPDHAAARTSRWPAPFGSTLAYPRLWQLKRHSTAGCFVARLAWCGRRPRRGHAGSE